MKSNPEGARVLREARAAFSYPYEITPASVEDMIEWHRRTFGGYRMEDAPTPEEKAAADKAAADAKGKDDPPKFEPITSQEDLDKRLGERLGRQKVQIEGRFSDYEDMKKKAAAHDKAIEAARTDQEKAVEAAKNEGRTEALTTANIRLISAEARALAAEAKFRNPALAVRALDLKGVTVNDDGEADAVAIKAKLKELSDADPYLLDDGKKPAPKSDRSQGGGDDNGAPSVAQGRDLWEERRGKKKTTA